MRDKERPTLQDVADQAGVSRATVSKALREDRSIPLPTRERIQAVAKDIGYHRDPVMSNLMTQLRYMRKRTSFEPMAFLTNHPTRHGWSQHTAPREFYEGASRRCAELGFDLQHFWLGDTEWNSRRMSDVLQARGIRAMLISPVSDLHDHLEMDWTRFAVAAFGYSLRFPPCHRVTNHHYHTMLRLLRALDEGGARRIGLILFKKEQSRINNNYWAAMLIYHQHISPEQCITPWICDTMDRTSLLRWVEQNRPEVIISSERRVLRWLPECGYRIPEDIGVAFLATDPIPESPAGMDQKLQAVGAGGVELVAEQVFENRLGIPPCQKVVLFESVWKPGPTFKPKPSQGPSLDWSAVL